MEYRDEVAGPRDRTPVWRLLDAVFGLDIAPFEAMGLMDPTYRTFSYFDEAGRCIANASTVALPLMLEGRAVEAMGVQSVATLPEWRGRGLSRTLLEQALAWCDSQAGLTVLLTSIPGFYEKLGFRTVQQSVFVGPAPPFLPAPDARRLDIGREVDRRELEAALRRRGSVSNVFAVRGWGGMFVLNTLGNEEMALWRLGPTGAIVATAARPDGALAILDVVAEEIPTLAEILPALGMEPSRVEVCFPPDKLRWDGQPVPVAESDTVLMVRGAFDLATPIGLPPTAAF